MMRITVEDRGDATHFVVEGKLAGAWVTELERCWRSHFARSPGRNLVVDLTNVDFVDLAGQYLLTLIHKRGATLTAHTPFVKALLADIALADAEPNHQSTNGTREEPGS